MHEKDLWNTIKLTIAPLLSLFILVLGNGLLNTLVALRLHIEDYTPLMIGAMTTAYYGGLCMASFKCERLIIRVGHIRAFSAFASLLAVSTVLHGLYVQSIFWLMLRLISGFATAGLFIVIESWLLVLGTVKIRGQILAIYMVSLYAGQAIGQFFINLADPAQLTLFAITSMLCSLAVIPLALTRVGSPELTEPSTLGFKHLFSKSASGVVGCFCAGLLLAPVYGLLPLYATSINNDTSTVAMIMFMVIFGGMILQYPVGRLSDTIERRIVLLMLSLGIITTSILCSYFITWYFTSLIVIFFFGGVVFTLYPVSISSACDALDLKDIVAGTQSLLLAYSLGAMIGPVVASTFMTLFKTHGLFLYFGTVGVFLTGFFLVRRATVSAPPHTDNFIPVPSTTPVSAELDPRGEAAS